MPDTALDQLLNAASAAQTRADLAQAARDLRVRADQYGDARLNEIAALLDNLAGAEATR
jgi:hypothetical protein